MEHGEEGFGEETNAQESIGKNQQIELSVKCYLWNSMTPQHTWTHTFDSVSLFVKPKATVDDFTQILLIIIGPLCITHHLPI